MILKILKSNQPFNFILFVIIGVLFWLNGFIKPQLYPFYIAENRNLLYKPIDLILSSSPFYSALLSLVLVILFAFIIQFINGQFAFIRIRTMLPAPLFILLMGGLTGIHTLHPVYFAVLFLLLAINRLFRIFENPRPHSAVFDAGFFLGIGSLFYFDLILIFPALFLGIFVLQKISKWRLFVINIIGFLLPFIFAFSYAFYTDQFLELLKIFENNLLTANNHFKSNVPLHIFLGFILLITAFGSIRILQQYDTKKVSTRKYFTVFFLVFLFSMFGFIFVPAVSHEMLVIMAIPVCYLISNYLVFMKSRFWGELIFTLLFGIVLFMQISAV